MSCELINYIRFAPPCPLILKSLRAIFHCTFFIFNSKNGSCSFIPVPCQASRPFFILRFSFLIQKASLHANFSLLAFHLILSIQIAIQFLHFFFDQGIISVLVLSFVQVMNALEAGFIATGNQQFKDIR